MRITKKLLRIMIFSFLLMLICIATLLLILRRADLNLKDPVLKELSKELNSTEKIIDYGSDGSSIYVLLRKKLPSEAKKFFVVFEQKDNGDWERSYENDVTSRKPWKLKTADIDGDGIREILIAVKKTTLSDPIEKNRLFIFNYQGGKLVKKWTGSQIAGDWKDFIVGDLAPTSGNELIFIEQTTEDFQKISVYSWFDFGFFLLASSESYQNIETVTILGENRLELQLKNNQKKTMKLTMQNGKLKEIN